MALSDSLRLRADWSLLQNATDAENLPGLSAAAMREELVNRWNELKAPVGDRVDTLVSLLDAAKVTPQMLAIYEALSSKLSARQPIAQVWVFLEHC